MLRGDTIESWSRRKGYTSALVRMSIRGLRAGVISRRIVADLKAELGL